ncbi:Ca2+/Na+ antiporter [Planomicrobium stackebrandtii]|uniref:Ca2+/Na+ antiporter n=1 Tax=Planomicrobium stackebrandtii TaxID=253160 RepID=A0ABU0GVU9_9BACL|nr:YndM family protein [Planomicrobium stackebrandtii]MDQ0429496.1 Ca2+/Na+ antiporter [Planomicrobium stackebrandtii]
MNHVKALIIKFVMIAVVLLVILTGIYDVEFSDTLLISVVLTLVAYVLGDLLIFRKTGNRSDNNRANHNESDHTKRNAIATVADIVTAFLVIWVMGEALFADTEDLMQAAIISALVIGAGEWFFHKYLDRNVFPEKNDHTTTTTR